MGAGRVFGRCLAKGVPSPAIWSPVAVPFGRGVGVQLTPGLVGYGQVLCRWMMW